MTDVAPEFDTLPNMLAQHVRAQPDKVAVIHKDQSITYGQLGALVDRVAAALQRDGVRQTQAVAICALSSIPYVAVFLGALRAGAAAAPLAPSSTPEQLVGMLEDCGASLLFLDAGVGEALAGVADRITARRVALDGSAAGEAFEAWLAPVGAQPTPVEIRPEHPFNIIYSSGTTGAPKGIVQSHRMRFAHIGRGGYQNDAVTVNSTPLYSNTTLVSFLPTLANGGTVVLMEKFDATRFLEESQKHGATHAMLVPVQYRRLMEHPDFDRYDLSAYRMKFCTSAPFSAELKRQVLERWPGGLVEYFGMTEGGGTCILAAHEHPDKLHTVGKPAPGHDIRLIGEDGKEVAVGEAGEIVGRSPAIMSGYHNQPGKTADAQWISPEGETFIRTGDVGRFDAEGFMTLMDRKKDMIISGGFNIYPSDLEAVLVQHPSVVEAAVVGVPSDAWGETPVAYVVVRETEPVSADAVKAWVNERVGKTQRLSDVVLMDVLPRSHIGKVLKRDLRDQYAAPRAA